MRRVPHWTDKWSQIEEQLTAQRGLLLACDFDGTLSQIVARPEQARLPSEMRSLLSKLVACPNVAVAIVSGRALADVRQRVDIEGVYYCGNHGMEIEGPDLRWSCSEARMHRAELAETLAILRRRTGAIPWVSIEDKVFTATVHWRMVPVERREELYEIVAPVVQSNPRLQLTPGKAIWEVRPRVDCNKGTALQFLLRRLNLTQRESVYLGDDDTDEAAFQALPQGVTLRVDASSASCTAASFRLNDVADTAAFLFCLLGALLSKRKERPIGSDFKKITHYELPIHVSE